MSRLGCGFRDKLLRKMVHLRSEHHTLALIERSITSMCALKLLIIISVKRVVDGSLDFKLASTGLLLLRLCPRGQSQQRLQMDLLTKKYSAHEQKIQSLCHIATTFSVCPVTTKRPNVKPEEHWRSFPEVDTKRIQIFLNLEPFHRTGHMVKNYRI